MDINLNSRARASRTLRAFNFAITLALLALIGFTRPAQALEGDELAKILMGQFDGTDHTRPRLPQVFLVKGLQEIVGGEVGIVSSTGSMVPALNYNDVAIVLPVKISQVKVGDIVVYHGFDAEGKAIPVIHRVIAMEPGAGLHMKGDANQREDETLVTDKNIMGRVRFVVRADNCQIRDYANNPAGELTTYRRLAAQAEMANKSPETVYAEQ